MNPVLEGTIDIPAPFLQTYEAQIQYIIRCQKTSGAISESITGKVDTWNHIECCIALYLSGFSTEARKGLQFLIQELNVYGSYFDSYPISKNTCTQAHHIAYIAVLYWLDFNLGSDTTFVKVHLQALEMAMNTLLSFQDNSGGFFWAKNKKNQLDKLFLKTGNANIYYSLTCALKIMELHNIYKESWLIGCKKLKSKFEQIPFDAKTEDFSMDWFYPVLSNLYETQKCHKIIEKEWHKFVIEDWGCLCVANQPWVTVAETCELILSLVNLGLKKDAISLFNNLEKFKDKDNLFWMGYQLEEAVFWPLEKPSWTAAAYVIAAHSLYGTREIDKLFKNNE